MAADGTIKIDTLIDDTGLENGLGRITGIVTDLLKDAIIIGSNFESAFAGVVKTVNATEDELTSLRQSIRNMAKEMPASADSIAAVAEAAGQLGIKTDNIIGFTRVMSDLGVATNMTATEAATALARVANITGMSQDNFDRLGSTIVALGNNFATTEAEIVNMALRLSGAGTQVGLSENQIMGLAAAMSSVGLQAEAGGSAMTRVLGMMQLACADGGEALDLLAKTSSMTAQEFKQAFERDAASALVAFLQGLNDASASGKSAIAVIAELGDVSQLSAMDAIMVRDALLRTSGASDILVEALGLANTAWEENRALTDEAAKRYETFDSKIQILSNSAKDLAISVFDNIEKPLLQAIQTITTELQSADMQGYVNNISQSIGNLLQGVIDKLPAILDKVAKAIAWVADNIDLLVAAVKTVIAIWAIIKLWNLTALLSGFITKLIAAAASFISLASAQGIAAAAQGVFNAALTANPIGVVVMAIAALIAGLTALVSWLGKIGSNTEFDERIKANAMAVTAFTAAVDNIAPSLADTSRLLSAAGRTLSELDNAINETESAITQILKSALSEQRQLREDELDSIRSYNERLEALQAEKLATYRQQMTVELMKINASSEQITQEGAAQSLKNLQVALDQAHAASEQSYNARLADTYNFHQAQGTLDTQAYHDDVARAKAAFEQERTDTTTFYNQGLSALTEHSKDWIMVDADKWNTVIANTDSSKKKYKAALAEIDLDNANAFLSMYLTAKQQGAEISGETEHIAKAMLSAFDNLPRGMRDAGKEALLGIIKGLEDQIPELKDTADMSADEIVDSLKDALDISSPSRVTEQIGKYAMSGLSVGMESMHSSTKNGLTTFISGLINGVKTQLGISNSKAQVFSNIGSSMIDGVYDGIEKKKSSFMSKLKDFFSGVVNSVKSFLGIASPSKLFRDVIGKNIGLGVISGVESTETALDKSIRAMLDNATLRVYATTIRTSVADSTGESVRDSVEYRNSGVMSQNSRAIPSAYDIARAIWDEAPEMYADIDGERVATILEPRVSRIQGNKTTTLNRRAGLATI